MIHLCVACMVAWRGGTEQEQMGEQTPGCAERIGESHTDIGHAKHRAGSIVGPTSNRQEKMMIRDKLSDATTRDDYRTGPVG